MRTNNKIDNPEYFDYLRKRPLLAWPTVMVMLCAFAAIGSSWYMVLNGVIPLWAGFIICFLSYYSLFSPIHDGLHHSISSNKKLNDAIANLAFLPVSIFMGGLAWARMFHMQHHRHAGKTDLDPDIEISSKGSNALWKWFVWGAHYKPYYALYKDRLPEIKQGPFNKTRVTISLVIFAVVFFYYPLEFLFLFLIPMYCGISWMTAFVFSFLPHHIHERREGADPTDDGQATCNIIGYEWILSPLTQYQNYHLVHHLYPTVPFYRYVKIWRAAYSKHQEIQPSEIKLAEDIKV